jgi:uncharacterized coiled-coil DUF342 family protein
VPRPATKTAARTTAATKALEAALDRVLVSRLRPLRADVTAARKSFEEQVTLRVEAEARATRLADEARQLRVRVQELEQQLATAQERKTGWLRRRAVVPRVQEA